MRDADRAADFQTSSYSICEPAGRAAAHRQARRLIRRNDMLTTTYSIVVLTSEQQNARCALRQLEQLLHNGAWKSVDGPGVVWFEHLVARLAKVGMYCQERRVELYLIPALRRRSIPFEAMAFLDRLDALNAELAHALRRACGLAHLAIDGGNVDAGTLVASMQLYCRQALDRLTLEERELLPIARRLLSEEDWFRIAAQCLSDKGAAAKQTPCRKRLAAGVYKCPRHESQPPAGTSPTLFREGYNDEISANATRDRSSEAALQDS